MSKIITESQVRDYFLDKVATTREKSGNALDKRLVVATARDMWLLEELKDKLDKVFAKGWYKPPRYCSKKKKGHPKRINNSLLGDTHFGAHLTSAENSCEYRTIEESRRLGKFAVDIAEYKTQYRDETKLLLHILGDIIQNQLHDPRDGETLTDQYCSALQYLVDFVLFECSQFPQVEVYCTPGNHGRNKHRHPEKAINQKWDSIETMLYFSLQQAILNAGVENCKFIIPKTPYYTFKLFGHNGFGTHGDTVFKFGNPGKAINVKEIARQVAVWNTARNVGGPFSLFIGGHVHAGSVSYLAGNVTAITNSCLVPPDGFTVSIGVPDSSCGQYIVESVAEHPVGDQRFEEVESADDKPRYNDIIRLYKGF